MSYDPDQLYKLLPSVHRVRDTEEGEPLRELLALVTRQVGILEEDLEQLYDNQFIETCAPWVLPYIGDLIGYRSLHPIGPDQLTPRAEVANTIGYRRRKGTAAVLEQLARDVTGWNARAVEYFQLLGWTQYMNHIRPRSFYAPDMRRWRGSAAPSIPSPIRWMCGASKGAADGSTFPMSGSSFFFLMILRPPRV